MATQVMYMYTQHNIEHAVQLINTCLLEICLCLYYSADHFQTSQKIYTTLSFTCYTDEPLPLASPERSNEGMPQALPAVHTIGTL